MMICIDTRISLDNMFPPFPKEMEVMGVQHLAKYGFYRLEIYAYSKESARRLNLNLGKIMRFPKHYNIPQLCVLTKLYYLRDDSYNNNGARQERIILSLELSSALIPSKC